MFADCGGGDRAATVVYGKASGIVPRTVGPAKKMKHVHLSLRSLIAKPGKQNGRTHVVG